MGKSSTTWQPGCPSPNPTGRPKTAPYAHAARELQESPHGEPPATWGPRTRWTAAQIEAYTDVSYARGARKSRRKWAETEALERVLNRTEGRPFQAVEVTVTDEPLPDEDTAAAALLALAELARGRLKKK